MMMKAGAAPHKCRLGFTHIDSERHMPTEQGWLWSWQSNSRLQHVWGQLPASIIIRVLREILPNVCLSKKKMKIERLSACVTD